MQSIPRPVRKWGSLAGAAFIVAAATLVTSQVIGQSQARSAKCACVATVNLPAVMVGLIERGDAELKLQEMANGMRIEDEARKTRIEAMREELKAIPGVEQEAVVRMKETIMLEFLEHKAWLVFAQEELDIEKSLLLRDLNRKINAAIADLSEVSGYDVVLMDDSGQKLGINPEAQIPREAQIRQQMTSRRALYVNPVANITDELVERMNNAYQAGG